MKQFTIYENPTDRPANWSSFHNADLPELYETEFQGITPFELPSFPPEAPAVTTAVVIHPFYILNSGKIHVGIVNGSTIPTLGGEPIGESGKALTLSGDMYVYIRNIWTLTFGSINFLSTATLSSSTIVTNSTPLADGPISGGTLTTYRLIAQVLDGVVLREQVTTTNLRNTICDASTGESGGQAANSTWSIF